jgi:hypothetical protein
MSTNGLLELSEHVERELAEYCAHDTYLCEQIFFAIGERDYPKANCGSST